MDEISFTKAAKAIRALGLRVSRDADGEIRVSFPGNESAAYYTTDPADALGTAQDMHKRAEAGAVPVADPEREAVESGEHIAGEPWGGAETFDAEPEPVCDCLECGFPFAIDGAQICPICYPAGRAYALTEARFLDGDATESELTDATRALDREAARLPLGTTARLRTEAETHTAGFGKPGDADSILNRLRVTRANIVCGFRWDGKTLEPGASALDGIDRDAEPENPARAVLSRVVNRCIADGSPVVREVPARPVPETLNGFPVVHYEPRVGLPAPLFYVVIDRGESYPAHRFVRATWGADCGDSWLWGHYVGTLRDALETIADAKGERARGARSLSAASVTDSQYADLETLEPGDSVALLVSTMGKAWTRKRLDFHRLPDADGSPVFRVTSPGGTLDSGPLPGEPLEPVAHRTFQTWIKATAGAWAWRTETRRAAMLREYYGLRRSMARNGRGLSAGDALDRARDTLAAGGESANPYGSAAHI